jgi:hypothetical protein
MFPIRRPTDEEGYVVEVPRDKDRYLHGRAGDHWLTSFQCDLCQFRNVTGHSPHSNGSEDRLLKFIRRATLDALWSRESGTVKNTACEIRNIYVKA